MPDKFDPYRESLVVEHVTIWPEGSGQWSLTAAERERIESQLRTDSASANHLTYVRVYTGFRREITVTPADVERVLGKRVASTAARVETTNG
ncbi:MAG: hypothetical protein ACOY3P_06400 [Planctomycetota bacterium]